MWVIRAALVVTLLVDGFQIDAFPRTLHEVTDSEVIKEEVRPVHKSLSARWRAINHGEKRRGVDAVIVWIPGAYITAERTQDGHERIDGWNTEILRGYIHKLTEDRWKSWHIAKVLFFVLRKHIFRITLVFLRRDETSIQEEEVKLAVKSGEGVRFADALHLTPALFITVSELR